jgi:hypothetical protein
MSGNWNRSARKSGGYRKAKIDVPRLDRDDLEILKQEAEIRREFGEEAVKRFWENIKAKE